MIEVGDEVVHQGGAGRFTVVKVEPSPRMNVYSRILTVRGPDGIEQRLLDTAVRRVEPAAVPEAAAAAKAAAPGAPPNAAAPDAPPKES